MKRILVSFLSLACPLWATNYYVATSGNNSNSGLIGFPKLTMQGALSIASLAGDDVINVGAGTFATSCSTDVSGASGHPITIRGAGSASTLITGVMTLDQSYYAIEDMQFYGISLILSGEPANHITISRCEFLRSLQGINFDSISSAIPHDVVIDDCEFHHARGNGMVECVGDRVEIKNCHFHHSCGNDAIRAFGDDILAHNNLFEYISSVNDTVYLSASSSTVTIGTGAKTFTIAAGQGWTVNDRVTATSAANIANTITGWVTSYSGTTLIVDAVTSSGSGTYSDFTVAFECKNNPYDPADGNHADIIQSFENSISTSTKRLKFYSNRSENCSGQLGNLENNAANTLVSDFAFFNNVFFNSRIQINNYTPNLSFYNNTIYSSDTTTGIHAANSGGTKGAAYGMKVKNNLFIRCAGVEHGDGCYNLITGDATSEADYNILTDLTDGGFTDLSAGAHSINGGVTPDQLFTDYANGDLTLKTGSPAIGVGSDLSAEGFSTDYNGETRSTWDIGAYAFGSEEPGEVDAAATPRRLRLMLGPL